MWFNVTKVQKTLQPLPSFSPRPTTHSVYFSHTFTEKLYVFITCRCISTFFKTNEKCANTRLHIV